MRLFYLILVFISLVLFISYLDSPKVRYNLVGNSPDCSVAQILNAPKKIDVLLLGSSAVRRGFSPQIMTSLSENTFHEVFNFGRPNKDIARSFTILNDLGNKRIYPKTVIVEIDLESIRGVSNKKDIDLFFRPGFYSYDVILTILKIDNLSFYKRIDYLVDLITIKLHSSITNFLLGKFYFLDILREKNTDAPNVCWVSSFDEITLEKESIKKEKYKNNLNIFPDLLLDSDERFTDSDTPQKLIELFYINQIRDYAKDHQIELYFVRLPFYADPPLSKSTVSHVKTLIPEFIYPPSELVRQNSMNFVDATHLNANGRLAYSAWLTSFLSRNK